MRSTLAVREKSFLSASRSKKIQNIIYNTGKKTGVKVCRFANSGSHLHLVILPRTRTAFQSFIRAIFGLIARLTLNAERGRGLGLKFWDARPFTRILEWGKDFARTSQYLLQNTLEALGFIPYQKRTAGALQAKPRPG